MSYIADFLIQPRGPEIDAAMRRINELRLRLHKLYKERGGFDAVVLAMSIELDEALNEVMRGEKKLRL